MNIQFRLFDEDPPPFPAFGPNVGWDLANVALPEVLQVDGGERERVPVVAVTDPATAIPTRGGYDMNTLVRFAAERAVATGVIENTSWGRRSSWRTCCHTCEPGCW